MKIENIMPTLNYYLYNVNSAKETLIVLHFRYSKTGKLIYSTRQKIRPRHWNKTKQRAKETDAFSQYSELNTLLNKIENETFNIYRKLLNDGINISNDNLKSGLHRLLNIENIESKPVKNNDLTFLEYFDLFIEESTSGIRLQKDGSVIRTRTIMSYQTVRNHLIEFRKITKFNFLLPVIDKGHTDLNSIKDYWKLFYLKFTDYLYSDLQHFDNSVGSKVKILKTFLNYVREEKNINIGTFYKSYYVRTEDIPIIVLQPDQLTYLITDKKLEGSLSDRLKRVKDIFVFGCTVALRVSDLLNLTEDNLHIHGNNYYLKVTSKKTGIRSSIKLPAYAVKIIEKYRNQFKTLLPTISDVKLNLYLKELTKLCNWNKQIVKTREKRGVKEIVYKDSDTKDHFTFADLITTHCMRKTAITTMLTLGIPERVVKEISGHSQSSKEFNRYVELSRSFIDEETDRAFRKIVK